MRRRSTKRLSSEEADLYSWYFEKERKRNTVWELAQHYAREFVRVVPIYASLHKNKNYEANTYALTHVEAWRRLGREDMRDDSLELFMTVADRLQSEKKMDKETEFYRRVEAFTRKIAHGEASLDDLSGNALSSSGEPEEWRSALRCFLRRERREWEELSLESEIETGIIDNFFPDPDITRAVSDFENRVE